MGGDGELEAGPGPAADAHSRAIQPPAAHDADLGAPVVDDDTYRGMPTKFADQARVQAEQLEQRLADQRLRDELARSNFAGRHYRRFENELARYGLSVQRGWMYSGTVFLHAAERGYGLRPTDRELDELHRDSVVREELANMTVGRALPRFRQDALVDGRWSAEGGASLATYFVGATLYVFPNEFRAWRARRERWKRQDHGDYTANGLVDERVTDPSILATGDLWVDAELSEATAREANIIKWTLAGYTQEEIVELGADPLRAP